MEALKNFYKIISISDNQGGAIFRIELNPSHPIYEGHFPGKPIVPGVCQLQILKECIGLIANHPLFFSRISSCKFVSPINPTLNRELILSVIISDNYDGTYNIQGEISHDENRFLKIKAVFTEKL